MGVLIDVRTLLFANCLVFVALSVAMTLVWQRNPAQQGLARLARVHVAMVAGAALIARRPGEVPALLSVVVGNTIVVLGVSWLFEGIRELYGRARSHWPKTASLLIVGGGYLFFLYVHPSLRARMLCSSCVLAALLLVTARTAYLGSRMPGEKAPSLVILGALGLLGTVWAARAALLAVGVRMEPLASDASTVALVSVSIVSAIGWTLGVMTLVNARLQGARQRAEAELARSEIISRGLLESIPDLMFRVGPEGVFLDFHAPSPELLAMPPEAFLGRLAGDVLPPELARLLFDTMKRAKDTNAPAVCEYRMAALDGTVREWEARVNPTPLGEFLVLSRDVTARKRYDAAVKEIVQVAAHELRSPLTSILGTLDLVTSQPHALLNDEDLRLLAFARRNSERMAGLIDDLLDLERIESGQMRFELAAVDLEALLTQARELNEGHARRLGVTVAVTTLPQARVLADQQRLLQVLVNLLSNAVKFSRAGGSVTVGVSRSEGAIRVEIGDHGPGIPRAFRTRIFQRFARGATPPGEHRRGGGLGLAISKAIIEGMAGRIGFESTEGTGSTFYFELREA